MSLDAIGSEKVDGLGEARITAGGTKEMFKTKDEFTAAATDVFNTLIAEKLEGLEAALVEELQKKQKQDAQDQTSAESAEQDADGTQAPADSTQRDKTDSANMESLVAAVSELTEQVKGVREKQEVFEQQISTQPGSAEVDDSPPEQSGQKASVFSGLLVRNAS
jgi:hypothetical protein